jgi:mono/diheme cytochrome c family protein
MKRAGADMNYAEAANLAQQSKKALLERLHNGGESMPSFSHLSAAEVNSLLVYLNHLAQIPGVSEDRAVVTESRERLGELIVKSTCHTCHSAVGTNPGPQELLAGAIPPLSTLTSRRTQPEFIRKVTHGYPVLMGVPAILYRGRMPVFFYLSTEEAADVYLYLTLYPPSDRGTNSSVVVASLGRGNRAGPSGGSTARRASIRDEAGSPGKLGSQTLLVAGVAAMVVLALAGGLYFTLCEFRRLSRAYVSRDPATDSFEVDIPMSSSSNAFDPVVQPLEHDTVNRSGDYQH